MDEKSEAPRLHNLPIVSSFRILTQADWSHNTEEASKRVGSIKCLQRYLKRKKKKPSLNFRLTIPQAWLSRIWKYGALLRWVEKLFIPREHRACQKGPECEGFLHTQHCWQHLISSTDNPRVSDVKTDASLSLCSENSQTGGCLRNSKWQSANSLSFAPVALLRSNTGQEGLDRLLASRPCGEREKYWQRDLPGSSQRPLRGL